MNKNTLILFDVGAVLVKITYRRFFETCVQISNGRYTAETFQQAYKESGLEEKVLKGTLVSATYRIPLAQLIFGKQDKILTDDDCIKILDSLTAGVVKEMVDIKLRCHEADYAVGIFSNIGEPEYLYLCQKHPEIFEVFSPINPQIYSFKVGSCKPEPEMYEKVRKYQTVVLVEDKLGYLEVGFRDSPVYPL